ncbi:hypothetical protein FLGE108171_15190 [Flavobacterium gelidilacus]|uniref:hypothetical protein n=1 Tax=Flavobacterium gelidilacus TaxID=206041 RepID=UPI00040EDB83|nr:hypothetical protein [Flavobacterium gelidilacus]
MRVLKKEIFCVFILLILFFSCKEKSNSENNQTIFEKSKIEGHTFYKVTETDSGKIIYKPCGAEVEKYFFYKDSVLHNWGQEIDVIKNLNIINEKYILYKGYNTNTNIKEDITIKEVDDKNVYWKINDILFIDEIHIKQIPLINEPISNCDNSLIDDDFANELIQDSSYKTKCIEETATLLVLDASSCYLDFYTEEGLARVQLEIMYKENSIYELIYKGLTGITRGNQSLDWENISTSEIISTFTLEDNNTILFNWQGFYNNKTKKREMIKNPFTTKTQNEPILLKICE